MNCPRLQVSPAGTQGAPMDCCVAHQLPRQQAPCPRPCWLAAAGAADHRPAPRPSPMGASPLPPCWPDTCWPRAPPSPPSASPRYSAAALTICCWHPPVLLPGCLSPCLPSWLPTQLPTGRCTCCPQLTTYSPRQGAGPRASLMEAACCCLPSQIATGSQVSSPGSLWHCRRATYPGAAAAVHPRHVAHRRTCGHCWCGLP
jgi:hypothetical protein